jgi:SAM-dependent methyltransferase
MFNFIAGLVVIIFSFVWGHFCDNATVVGGATVQNNMFAGPVAPPVWFDPKTFVVELEKQKDNPSAGWWIGAGFEPSAWERVDPKRWPSQVQLHDRDGFTLANERHTMRWCDWQKLPDVRETEYLRSWRADLDTIKGENAFLMTPYLREWQRRHLWPHVPERSKLLDIGVGTGRSKDLWFDKRLEVWGVEPNEQSIKTLERRRLPPVRGLRPWGGENPEIQKWLQQGAIDLVMMSYSITFFFRSQETLAALVQNLSHVLRPGGRFLLIGMDGERVEQWFKVAAKAKGDVLDNPLFTIKKEGKFKEKVFGREIEITMKNPNTLVEAQREYLVDFSHFRKVLAKAGLKCVEDRHVAAPEWMGEWPRKFVEAQRFLVFDRL